MIRVVLATSRALIRAHEAQERGQRVRREAWLAVAGLLLFAVAVARRIRGATCAR